MGALVREGYSRLDNLIAEFGPSELIAGDSALIDEICAKVSQGEKPWEIATKHHNIAWMVLRKWIEDDGKRSAVFELAKRCWADRLVWDAVSAARDAGIEDVSVSKLQADTYLKVAAKADRGSWGDAKEDKGAGITLVIDRSCGGTVKVEGGVVRIGIEEGAGTHIKDVSEDFAVIENEPDSPSV
ncbi:MAG: hypothetical protein MOGMAGMI_01957 [Candidatus Omnitrophica bacterium]|nr:hypothetical protein [Candidatus Omnitrophota bacterium]